MSARWLRSRLSFSFSLGAALFLALTPRPARALQPLSDFLEAAKARNPDLLEASANVDLQDATADVQLGHALPGIQLRGTYTHNQYDAEFPYTIPAMGTTPASTTTIIIQPFNQFDFYATLNVPLIDLGQFKRISAAKRGVESSRKQLEAVQLQVAGAVAQAYYQLVANLALVDASKRQIEVAQQSLKLTQDKFDLGSGPELDVDRAKSEVERQVQQLAAADLQKEIAKRSLFAASGVEAKIDSSTDFVGDLHQEASLDELEKQLEQVPAIRAAVLATEQADANASAQKFALVPALSGSLTEHVSNAPGFVGSDAAYQLLLALTWNFDFTNIANIHLQEAQAAVARAHELRARISAGDALNRDWNTVRAAIAQSQSARAELAASKRGADQALDRYKAGAATQLDLLSAQRDAFSAEVARIQADADLANARAQLRLSIGQPIGPSSETVTSAPAEKGVQPK